MDDEEVNSAIAEIELGLSADDPSAGRRMRRTRHVFVAKVAAVVGSLIAALILLTVGLAMMSGGIWMAGLVVFLLAFAFDPYRTSADADGVVAVDQRVDQWDECVWVSGTWSSIVGELRAAGGLDRWCPSVRQFADGGRGVSTVSIGRWRPIRLEVRRRWFAEGIRWRAGGGGPIVTGHLRCQPAATGDEVLVWVHAEARRCRHSRRALRALRQETRAGLRRWAMTHSIRTRR